MDYNDFTVDKLKALLKERSLPNSGVKKDLVNRLEKQDEEARLFQMGREMRESIHRSSSYGSNSTAVRTSVSKDPKEDELERICRENYEPFPPGFSSHQVQQKIRVDCQTRIFEAREARKKVIDKAYKKYDIEVLSAEQEECARLDKDKKFSFAYSQLRDLKERQGFHIHCTDFAPKNDLARKLSLDIPGVDIKTRREHSPPARPAASVCSRASSKLNRAPPKSPNSPLSGRHSTPPPKRPRLSEQDKPGSAIQESDRRASGGSDDISATAIRPQLSDKNFIWIPAIAIHVRPDRLDRIRKMFRSDFATAQVRADMTGYFIVFGEDDEGIRLARACFDKFNGQLFVGHRMEMHLIMPGLRRIF